MAKIKKKNIDQFTKVGRSFNTSLPDITMPANIISHTVSTQGPKDFAPEASRNIHDMLRIENMGQNQRTILQLSQ
jgi:hypothetical protein